MPLGSTVSLGHHSGWLGFEPCMTFDDGAVAAGNVLPE